MARRVTISVVDRSRAVVLGDRIVLARTPLARLRGLLGRAGLGAGEGLLLRPCNGVHTWGMRFSIDVVFLDAEGTVIRIEPGMSPRRMVPWVRRAKQALELPAGSATAVGLSLGMRLDVEERAS